MGEDSRAFASWRGGHSLLKTLQPFPREATRAYDDAAIATFTPERYARGPRAGIADPASVFPAPVFPAPVFPAPVFIVGMPRSGTTLAEQVIGAHPQAHAAGERSALG